MEKTFRKSEKTIKKTQSFACIGGNILAGISIARDNFSDDGHRRQTKSASSVRQIAGLLPIGPKYHQGGGFMVRRGVGGSKRYQCPVHQSVHYGGLSLRHES